MIDQADADKIRVFWADAQRDSTWRRDTGLVIERRRIVQREILQLLQSYLNGSSTASEFRATFDLKSRTEWNLFGMKGMSGAMVLNQIVKHISDEALIAAKLKPLLAVPSSEEEARGKINTFMGFIRSYGNKRIAEGHTPFFLSAWWHMQASTEWPIFFTSGRIVLQDQDIYHPTHDLAEDYLQFRSVFNELRTRLNLDPWWLELFLAKLEKHTETPGGTPPGVDKPIPPDPPTGLPIDATDHTQAQWLLGSLGHKLGCTVWIARNDHGHTWNGQELRTLSIDKLPSLGLGDQSDRIIQLIDVVWLKGNQIQAAFEIECSTAVYSGLLRMSDLAVASPNLNFPLFILAPKERGQKVTSELSRPTFQQLEIHKRCGYIELESFIAQFPNVHAWADRPSAIRKLAVWVPDVNS